MIQTMQIPLHCKTLSHVPNNNIISQRLSYQLATEHVLSYHLLWHTRGLLCSGGKISFYSRTVKNKMTEVIPVLW